jgi:hypothetical protein
MGMDSEMGTQMEMEMGTEMEMDSVMGMEMDSMPVTESVDLGVSVGRSRELFGRKQLGSHCYSLYSCQSATNRQRGAQSPSHRC